MSENNQIDKKDAIRIDIVKLVAFVVLYVLTMLIAASGIATVAFGIYCGIKWQILVWFVFFGVFCIALVAFIVIYKKVFGKQQTHFNNTLDIDG